nr:MAG TPA: hypothetical protein [Caudoviricetes sp.]
MMMRGGVYTPSHPLQKPRDPRPPKNNIAISLIHPKKTY